MINLAIYLGVITPHYAMFPDLRMLRTHVARSLNVPNMPHIPNSKDARGQRRTQAALLTLAMAKGANPSPVFLSNGSVVVVGTGFGGPLQVAYADTWKGPYREVSDLPFVEPKGTKFEDPGMISCRGLPSLNLINFP